MTLLDIVIQWLLGIVQFIFGFLFGSIVTGYFTVKWIFPRLMKNPEVQEFLKLLREGKSYLQEILENLKEKDAGTKKQ